MTDKGDSEAAKLQHEDKSTELRELRAKHAHLKKSELLAQQEVEALTDNIALVIDERDDAQAETHKVKKLLQVAEANCQKLQEQVAQFKKVISSSSQTENQVADDVIRVKSEQLFYDIQEFVVKTFKGVKFGKPPQYSLVGSDINANFSPARFLKAPERRSRCRTAVCAIRRQSTKDILAEYYHERHLTGDVDELHAC